MANNNDLKKRLDNIEYSNKVKTLLDMLQDDVIREEMLKSERTVEALKKLRKALGKRLGIEDSDDK